MNILIQAQELSRWYGMVMGLNNVTFQIEPGLTGLVGPNGAGKSTLIQIITGQLKPSSGRLTVFGEEPWNNPVLLRRIGYCPEGDVIADASVFLLSPAARFVTGCILPVSGGAELGYRL